MRQLVFSFSKNFIKRQLSGNFNNNKEDALVARSRSRQQGLDNSGNCGRSQSHIQMLYVFIVKILKKCSNLS